MEWRDVLVLVAGVAIVILFLRGTRATVPRLVRGWNVPARVLLCIGGALLIGLPPQAVTEPVAPWIFFPAFGIGMGVWTALAVESSGAMRLFYPGLFLIALLASSWVGRLLQGG